MTVTLLLVKLLTMGEENSASKAPKLSGGEPQADMFW